MGLNLNHLQPTILQDKGIGKKMKCSICNSTNDVEYCSMCEEYLCKSCKNNPPKRLVAMLKKKYKGWFPKDEVEDMKRRGEWK